MKNNFDMSWNEARNWMLSEFGSEVEVDDDPNDPCFYCLNCGGPIYKVDYPFLKMSVDGEPLCPICEEDF